MPDYLSPILIDPRRLKREAVKRRKLFDEEGIGPDLLTEYQASGWEFSRQLKRLTKVQREKSVDERLENRVWMLLFKLGYPELSEGRRFTVLIERKGAEPLRKQIDAFAKDDETVVVVECKASEKISRRSLQKDIEEFANLKGPVAQSIHRHYGAQFRPKIIWLFVTENIIWSQPDKERAAGQNIRIITERELRYYVQIADHLGRAARYQFLAEFLKNQVIPELSERKVPAIRGKLGGRRIYTFLTTPRHLLKISFVNHRSLNDPEGAPTYQRLISRGRLREISNFIKNGGFFPNSLLLNFVRPVKFEKSGNSEDEGIVFGSLYLPDKYRSVWIIDGQHRLYGYSPVDDKFLDQNVVAVAFEQIDKTEEANLFVTINHEQKSVPKHLLDDLEGELKWGSTIPGERIGAIASRLINLLNTDVGEPFHNRVTQQGIASTNKTCLTIPAVKDALRRSGLLGRTVLDGAQYDTGPLCGPTDSESLDRARNAINQYFNLIRNANMSQWENGRESVLCTNVAVQGYILLLGSLIKYWEANTAADAREMPSDEIMAEMEEYLSPVIEFLEQASPETMRQEFQVQFGSGGPKEYYFRLCRLIKGKYSDFQPDGLEDWEVAQSEERIDRADKQVKEIVTEIIRVVFTAFKKIYGEDRGLYFDKGISDKGIKTKAFEKSLDDSSEERLPLEGYLDVIDLKRIIENRQNWPRFKPVFNIPEPGEKGLAKNLKWLDRLNEIRRVSAHPSDSRHYQRDDLDYLDFLHLEFFQRVRDKEHEIEGTVDDPIEGDKSGNPSE